MLDLDRPLLEVFRAFHFLRERIGSGLVGVSIPCAPSE